MVERKTRGMPGVQKKRLVGLERGIRECAIPPNLRIGRTKTTCLRNSTYKLRGPGAASRNARATLFSLQSSVGVCES